MLNDLRYAARILLKKPVFTLVAILSLALGIGANTAIFSLLDAVMLRSLPVTHPQRLVLFGNARGQGVTNNFPSRSWDLFSYPFYREVQQNNQVFSGVASLVSIPWVVHGRVNSDQSAAEVEKLNLQLVSGTYFDVLGVSPAYGRMISDADDQAPGASPVAVISYAFWQKRFGSDRAAVGKTITIDKVTYSVIGVAPSEFFGTNVGEAPDLFLPLAMEKEVPPAYWEGRNDKEFQSLFVIGRLKDGVTTEQASAAVNVLFKRHLQDRAGPSPAAATLQNIERAGIELTPVGTGLSQLRKQFSLSLKILMGLVGLVLLISCANVANLLLAHGAARRREFAVRLAVGAARTRLIRQLFTESLLLATIGGAVGVVLAWWGSRILVVIASAGPAGLLLDVDPNPRILAFTLLVSLVSAVAFGIAPALRAVRVDLNSTLKAGKGTIQSALRNPFGKALVVSQVALCLLLLIGAGLFVRTLINLRHIPSGFNQSNVLVFQIDTSASGYRDDDPRLSSVMRDVEQSTSKVPGVQGAAFSFFLFNQGTWTSAATADDHNQYAGQSTVVRNNIVGNDYFDVVGIPLLAGRRFGEQDSAKSPKVALVSESMAKHFYANGAAVGRHFGISGPESANETEIIGIVKDAKYVSLTEDVRPMVYFPLAQRPAPLSNLVVKVAGPTSAVVPQLRAAIKAVNHDLPIDEVTTFSDHIDRSLIQQRLIAQLASFFGVLALVLSCIGLYGVMSYAVAQRTNEIGIRMALGAGASSVLWLIMREVLKLVIAGVLFGLVASYATTRTAESLLFGLKPNDPLTLVSASLFLTFIALLAGYLPARRAARISPTITLREE